MSTIRIENATEGNLKGITLDIPKGKLVVFSGLSGSGKSTLLIDVLFGECQRQYLEAMGMQGIHKPKVDRIRGVSPAVLITQTDQNKNPRSTVGTLTDIYTDLRMVYEKLSVRPCSHCQALISAADCREETEKVDGDFRVYMHCPLCGHRMDKLTRTSFSFNTKEGACPTCEGLGQVLTISRKRTVNEALSLEDGAIAFWERRFGEYQTQAYYQALRHYGIPIPENTPVAQFSDLQKAILYDGILCDAVHDLLSGSTPPKTVAAGRFEGVLPMLWKRMSEHEGHDKRLDPYFDTLTCPSCGGERLQALSRNATVHGRRLPELSVSSLEHLHLWVDTLKSTLSRPHLALVADYLTDLQTKLHRLLKVGLGYLSLDRQTITLSGGELQRLRLAAILDSDLSGVIYIMDEPTLGLHPRDTAGLVDLLKGLRDLGNTVLVIEHDPDVLQQADYVIDVGPGAGRHGGQIVGCGTLQALKDQPTSITGHYLSRMHPGKSAYRMADRVALQVRGACRHNLKSIDVDLPAGCLTAITGPSGSGKSTLVFGVLARGSRTGPGGIVTGLDSFDAIIEIGQAPITRMKRSNIATYSGVFGAIRQVFSSTEDARYAGLTAKHFSFNTPGGRCERCEGLGYVTSNMLFFKDIEVVCPACGGRQFSDEVLSVKYKGHSIHDVMQLDIQEAMQLFAEHNPILRSLSLLLEVGLGYLTLGQTLTTLSGGEGQRLKLAKELIGTQGKHNLYLLDEPSTGLHPVDVAHFLVLLDRMVDQGHTVVVVEHNQQIIRHSDWVIDLGPEGGDRGGEIMFTGTPQALLASGASETAKHLRQGT